MNQMHTSPHWRRVLRTPQTMIPSSHRRTPSWAPEAKLLRIDDFPFDETTRLCSPNTCSLAGALDDLLSHTTGLWIWSRQRDCSFAFVTIFVWQRLRLDAFLTTTDNAHSLEMQSLSRLLIVASNSSPQALIVLFCLLAAKVVIIPHGYCI